MRAGRLVSLMLILQRKGRATAAQLPQPAIVAKAYKMVIRLPFRPARG